MPNGLLLAYFIWTSISVSWATNFSEAIFESQKVVLGFGAFYLCRWSQLNDKHFAVRLLKGLLLLGGLVLIIAVSQIITMDSSLPNAHYAIRGISGHKNLFSIVVFLLAGFSAISYFKLENNWRKAAGVLFVLFLLLLLYLRTRSVYLGIATASSIYAWRKLTNRLRPTLASSLTNVLLILITISILGFLYLWATNQLIDILHASKIDQLWKSDTGYERIILWEKTACLIKDSPLWGVGAGNWQIEFPNCSVHGLYSVEVDSTTYQRPHNDWFWVWAETGIIGLLFYLGFFITILRNGFQSLKQEISFSEKNAALAQLAFITGFMVIACFSFPKERIEILLLTFTHAGIYIPSVPKPNKKFSLLSKGIFVLIILSTALNIYIGKKRITGERNMKNVLILKQQNNWPDIISASNLAYSKWYTIDPTTIPIHWYRATSHFILGQEKQALENFLKAAEHAPYNQNVHNDLGSCYLKLGQIEKARDHYNEAIRISPLFDDPRVNLGISYYKEGNYREALDWINSIQNYDLKMKYRKIITDKQNDN
jgi:O-antigen ligase